MAVALGLFGAAPARAVDFAKDIFPIYAIAADGASVIRRQVRRAELLKFFSGLSQCLVGMEACASAHHWARQLIAMGHRFKLMLAAYVKAYVKRGKTDALMPKRSVNPSSARRRVSSP